MKNRVSLNGFGAVDVNVCVHKLCDVWCCAGKCNHPAISRLCDGAVPNCDGQKGDVSQFEVVSKSAVQSSPVKPLLWSIVRQLDCEALTMLRLERLVGQVEHEGSQNNPHQLPSASRCRRRGR